MDRRLPIEAALSRIPAALRRRGHHLAAAALACAFAADLAGVATAPWRLVQVDEPGWISSGYRTFRLVASAAPPGEWRRVYAEEANPTFFDLNPTVSKLAAGALAALVREPDDPVRYYWEWPGSRGTNAQAGNLPPEPLLHGVRLGFVGIALGTLALVYAIALQLTGARWLALLAPTALFLSPIFRMHATQICLEGPQLLLMVAAVAAWNDHLLRGRAAGFWTALVLMGLACAAKLNSAPLVLAAGLFGVLREGSAARRLSRLAAAGVVPLAVFVAANPFFWDDPPARIRTLLSDWSAVKEAQRADPTLADRRVESRAQGLGLMLGETLASPSFDHRRLRGVGNAAALVLGGLLLVAVLRFRFDVGAVVGGPGAGPQAARAALAVAMAIGLACGLGFARPSALVLAAGLFGSLAPRAGAAGRRRAPAAFVALAAGLTLVMTGLWLPHAWSRYYLPTLVLLPAFYVAGAQLAAAIFASRSPRRAPRALALESRP